MSASWSPASLCPEPNELLQPRRTLPRVCRGPGLSQHTQLPFTPRPAHWARWWARGSKKAPRSGGADLMVFRVAIVGPRGWQGLHRGPQCPGAHLAPFMGTVPARTGARPSPWAGGGVVVGGRMSSFTWQPTLRRLAQHMWTYDTEKERGLKEERCSALLFRNNNRSFIHFYNSHHFGTF